jgi:putative transposase
MSLFRNKYRIESIRLKEWDYSNPWYYYVTINTKNHIQYFGNILDGKMILNRMGKIVNQEWQRTNEIRKNVELDYYTIMPNHIHGIVIINGVETHSMRLEEGSNSLNEIVPDTSVCLSKNCLSDIIRGFKSSVTKQIINSCQASFAWQPRFYDRIIRNEKELFKIRLYIEQNPLRWELEKNQPENLDI